jgi:two-component system, cell cycle sensor histidine kinase and response regulator CckA
MPIGDDGRAATAAPVFADPRVRTFASLGDLLMYRADLESGELAWIPTLLERWGYTDTEIEATTAWWLGITHPDDRAVLVAFLEEALAGRRTEWGLRYRMRRADGTWAHVLGRARLLRDEDGRPLATEGVVRDVSTMAAAEEELRDREQRYRLLAENSRELICRHDPDGTYRYVSPAVRELAGWTPAEMLGKNPYEFFHSDDRTRIAQESHDLALRGELDRVGIVYRFLRRDGSFVWLETLTRPILDADGGIVALQTSSRDVSERRQLQEQLARGQRLEAIGTLAGGVAHDFNSLLTVVIGNTELLLEDAVDAETRSALEEVRYATRRAVALTRQLLILGRQELPSNSLLDLARTLRALEPIATRMAGGGVRVTLKTADGCWVTGDQGQLEQVVLNLVGNACAAMPDGGALRISCEPIVLGEDVPGAIGHVPAGSWLRLAVSDNGIGMSSEVLGRASEPFFTTKPTGQGTGLGLATVQTILQGLRGHLTIESKQGSGTTVTCWLPPAPAPAASQIDRSNRTANGLEGSDLPLVLVVDDEPAVRWVTQRMLERHGYRVATAEDGGAALAAFDRGLRPAMVLTDVMMPVMSGRALADALHERGLRLPIVFMSGYAREELLADGLLGNELPLVHKPFTPATLLNALRDALASASEADSSASP